MYRIEFIDNCNKLRSKYVLSLQNVNFEVYNFVTGIYDEFETLLDKKYLQLTELELVFYGNLSKDSITYLLQNAVLQPAIRTLFDSNKLIPDGNNYLSFDFYPRTKETLTRDGQEHIINLTLENPTLSLKKGFRYIKIFSFAEYSMNMSTLFDQTKYSRTLIYKIYFGNSTIQDVTKSNYVIKAVKNYKQVLFEGFLNTDLYDITLEGVGIQYKTIIQTPTIGYMYYTLFAEIY